MYFAKESSASNDVKKEYNVQVSTMGRRAVRLLNRRYDLTITGYKYLEIGINVGPPSYVEIALGDHRGHELPLSLVYYIYIYYIYICNPEIKTGYLPRLDFCEGVFAGDALVTCINNKAYIRVINTLDHKIELIIPTIKLQEVSKTSHKPLYNEIYENKEESCHPVESPEKNFPGNTNQLIENTPNSLITLNENTNMKIMNKENNKQKSLSSFNPNNSTTSNSLNLHPSLGSLSSAKDTHPHEGPTNSSILHPSSGSLLSAKKTHPHEGPSNLHPSLGFPSSTERTHSHEGPTNSSISNSILLTPIPYEIRKKRFL
ncbi:hypothetical protein ALC57_04440 [Trachymyrmex cornetzi]|uniref:Uncharacterized protein n=1 Tax=Trachymyrmex cornetzi TaxID=471704 RepID=A0A151JCJ5_9HYME|nr:hypothetical protein ALC57_04440 [Trachymyrmex cornetzi]